MVVHIYLKYSIDMFCKSDESVLRMLRAQGSEDRQKDRRKNFLQGAK